VLLVPCGLPFLLQLFSGGKLKYLIFICAETIQEMLFLKSECPYEKRTMSGVVSLINLKPGFKPSVKPCSIPAIWTKVRAKAANPTRQLPLAGTLPLYSEIRGKV